MACYPIWSTMTRTPCSLCESQATPRVCSCCLAKTCKLAASLWNCCPKVCILEALPAADSFACSISSCCKAEPSDGLPGPTVNWWSQWRHKCSEMVWRYRINTCYLITNLSQYILMIFSCNNIAIHCKQTVQYFLDLCPLNRCASSQQILPLNHNSSLRNASKWININKKASASAIIPHHSNLLSQSNILCVPSCLHWTH